MAKQTFLLSILFAALLLYVLIVPAFKRDENTDQFLKLL